MNDYKELIKKSLETLSYAEQINPNTFYLTRADLKIIADAIEQLVKERDAAVKCIEDIETYLQMGSAKYIDKTIKEWRGVQE